VKLIERDGKPVKDAESKAKKRGHPDRSEGARK